MSFSHSRQKKLIEMIQADGEVRIRDLMLHFNISEETARRDIKQLEQDGLIVRVHGGAVATQQPKLLAISSRTISERDGKNAIAAIAMDLLKPGQNLFFGGGSTVLSLAAASGFCRKCASSPTWSTLPLPRPKGIDIASSCSVAISMLISGQ
ncbi:DeoR family transcriptional regulator [Mesorhizobium sp. 43Arga]